MRAAFLLPARNKSRHVRESVRSVLAQTSEPIDILLSDQGSEDDTYAIMEEEVRGYSGPHRVSLLSCPDVPPSSMIGFNRHVNWLHTQTDADVIFVTSADDLTHPHRVDRTLQVYRETGASMVGTAMQFINPDGTDPKETAHPDASGWVKDPADIFAKKIGGSSSCSWSRDLFEKYGPFEGSLCFDVAMPFYATMERGYFFLKETLQVYVNHSDPKNMGLEGRYRACETDIEKKQVEELIFYQVATTCVGIGRKAEQARGQPMPGDQMSALALYTIGQCDGWARARDALTEARVPPLKLID